MWSRILFSASLLSLVAASFAARPCDATTIPGGNLVNQTWIAAGSPYIVLGDVSIPAGAYLNIDPGVEVRFASSDGQASGLDVGRVELTVKSGGTLAINGTAAAPVTLMAQSGTSSGIWFGIVVESGATSAALHHAVLEHSSQGARNFALSGPSCSTR